MYALVCTDGRSRNVVGSAPNGNQQPLLALTFSLRCDALRLLDLGLTLKSQRQAGVTTEVTTEVYSLQRIKAPRRSQHRPWQRSTALQRTLYVSPFGFGRKRRTKLKKGLFKNRKKTNESSSPSPTFFPYCNHLYFLQRIEDLYSGVPFGGRDDGECMGSVSEWHTLSTIYLL